MSSQRRSRRVSPSPQTTVGSGLALIVLIVVLFVYRSVSNPGQPMATPLPPAPGTSSLDWFSVYFTDPGAPNADSSRGGPDSALAAAIDGARLSVDIAAYDFDLWSLRDALLDAQRRGVTVRMVTDSDNLENDEVQNLKEAGISVVGDRREGLMHDKFVVIDRLEVWGGSMNFTVNDAYKNNNNLTRVRSSRLAEDYSTEFEEMFVDDHFGPSSPSNTPYPNLSVEGTRMEVYFSPDDGVADHLIQLVQGAQHSILFLAYSFTSDDLADAMLERAQDGIRVAGVFEEGQVESNRGDEYSRMRSAGLDVRLDGNPRNMHHKVIVIDGQIVVTGSYNFSASAENNNDENIMVIYNSQIASQYEHEFTRVFAQAQP